MHTMIIITLVLSLKALFERDIYKAIATNPPGEILKMYTAQEMRAFLVDCTFKVICTFYELIFYIVLYYNIPNIFVLSLAVLHWGMFLRDLPQMFKGGNLSTEKEWNRRVVFCKIWALAEIIFLGYILYSLGWKNV